MKGFVSAKKIGLTNLNNYCGGYGATYIDQNDSNIPCFTLEEIKEKYNLNFNALVADCEGFLERFFDENPILYDGLRIVIFEADYPDKCDYNKIRNSLKEKGFNELRKGHQNVWVNPTKL